MKAATARRTAVIAAGIAGIAGTAACHRRAHYTLEAVYAPPPGESADAGVLKADAAAMRRRLDALEAADARIEVKDGGIVVDFVRLPEGLVPADLAAQGGVLELVPVRGAPLPARASSTASASFDAVRVGDRYWSAPNRETLALATSGMNDVMIGDGANGTWRAWRVDRPRAIVSPRILEAQASTTDYGGPTVLVRLAPEAAQAFGALTGALAADQGVLLIVLDGRVMSAPRVMDPITGGNVMISLGTKASPADAKKLAASLVAGALPYPLELARESRLPAR